jgi:dipeptidyl aminopeptidase/acylaminoacyl peptidase
MTERPTSTSGPAADPASHRAIAERIIGNLTQAGQPTLSPDGRWLAFTVARVDLEANRGRSTIWLAPVDGSEPPRPLTSGDVDNSPVWSPDSRALAFSSRRGDAKRDATLHLLPVDSPGEVRTLASMKDGVDSVAFSPDGRWVAFVSRTPDERYSVEGAADGDERWQSPRRVERFFTKLDNEGWIFDRPAHIYVVPVDGTAAPRNLTPGEFQHDAPSWTHDSQAVVVSAARHDSWDLDFAYDIYRVGLDGTITAVTTGTGQYALPSCSPLGPSVALIGYDDPNEYPQNGHVGVVDMSAPGAAVQWLSRGLDRTFETTAGMRAPAWADGSWWATAEDRGATHLYRISPDASAAPVAVTDGAITVKSFDIVDTATGPLIAYCAGSVDGVADVFVVCPTDGQPRRVTDFAQRYRAAAHPLTWERFAVPCPDDSALDIDAWIMRPANFDATRTYPVLLNVHGGPHTQYGETFFDEAQVQAAAGFVVLMSNPRGGSGREQSWGQAIMGPKHPTAPGSGWGGVDVDDVLAVLDATLDRYPFCDPQRVGMLGGSYGGFMATWLAAYHGDRFKGICSERAVNNLLTEEFTSDISTIFRIEHGPRHVDDPDEYVKMSPIAKVHDIHVPMLIIHSENDFRCPISQAEELFVALRLLRRDVTFYRFPGEGHELSRSGSPVHRRMRAEIILDWFADKLAAVPVAAS